MTKMKNGGLYKITRETMRRTEIGMSSGQAFMFDSEGVVLSIENTDMDAGHDYRLSLSKQMLEKLLDAVRNSK